jgi:hypothetical protein
MTTSAYIPAIVAIIGLILYLVAGRWPKIVDAGRIAFIIGLAMWTLTMANHVVSFAAKAGR